MIWERHARGALYDIFGIGGAVQGGASIAAAGIQAAAASHAADVQADAARYAADQTAKTAENSLAYQKDVYNKAQELEQPYVDTGKGALNQLNSQFGDGGPQWDKQFSFSGLNLENDPAYQFNLQQGQQAIQRSAAARGGLVSGGALKDLNDYSQGYAANSYQQAYNNALNQYQMAYNQFQNNQNNSFNRLTTLAQIGQQGAAAVNNAGAGAATNVANINSNAANALGSYATQAGNAAAAGTVGVGNAINNGIAGVNNAMQQQQVLNALNRSSYGGGGSRGGVFDSNGDYLGE